MKKICVIGSHGTGKTTLTYAIASYLKNRSYNVRLINESARECPFPLNDNFNIDGAKWIIHRHILKELDAKAQGYDVIVSDRSPIDTVMYADRLDINLGFLETLAEDWMYSYDYIFVSMMTSFPIESDGVRSVDELFQKEIHDRFMRWVHDFKRPYTSVIGYQTPNIITTEFNSKEPLWHLAREFPDRSLVHLRQNQELM